MEYKVIFDTQAVWNDAEKALDQLFSKSILDVKDFLKEHNATTVQLCLSEMVVEERIQHKLEAARDLVTGTNEAIQRLKVLGYQSRPLDSKKIKEAKIRKFANDFVAKNDIEILEIPKLKSRVLVDRAIKKIKPFNDKKSGFKDTIILLSILENAKKITGECAYILVTNNTKDFSEEVCVEFEKVTKKKLYVVEDVEKLKVLLDRLIPLRLELKNLHREVKEAILKNTGSITAELNRKIAKLEQDVFPWSNAMSLGRSPFSEVDYGGLFGRRANFDADDEKKIVGYNFSEIDIENISDIGNGKFTVSGTITVEPQYNKKSSNYAYDEIYTYGVTPLRLGQTAKTYNFSLGYDKNQDTIINTSFDGGLPSPWRL